MKRIFLLTLLSTVACGIPIYSYYFDKEYELNEQREITVGTAIMSWERGNKVFEMGRERKNGYRFELIYTGIFQNVIYVLYREYSVETGAAGTGSFIRPDFSHEYRYDLSQNKIITFREIKIRVHEATSESLKYSILNGVSETPAKYNVKSEFDEFLNKNVIVHCLDSYYKTKSSFEGTLKYSVQDNYIILAVPNGTEKRIAWNDIVEIEAK